MKTWDDWSDFKINKRIADFIFPEQIKSARATKENVVDVLIPNGVKGFYRHEYVDYCNNWSDMGPIIVDNGITITPYQDESQGWFATTDTSFFVDDKNPLRAAAIVFLMVNGVKP